MESNSPSLHQTQGDSGGAALHEFPPDDKDLKAIRKPGVSATAFVLWDGFGTDPADFLNVQMSHPNVLDAALKAFQGHLDARYLVAKGTFIDTLKADGVYPYETAPTSRVEVAERDLFDLVIMTAEPAISGKSKEQRALSTRLLHLALEERPESLDRILGDVLNLDPQVRDDLADLLTRSSLPSIIRTLNEVTRRIDLLLGLRHYLYETDDAQRMREVDQLHPLVRDNTWLFGEHWHLTRSEASLTNVIKAVLTAGTGVEEQPDVGVVKRDDGTTGRVDLLMHRSLATVHGFRRLVVELKRPTTVLRLEHLNQIKSYAKTLAAHPGAKSEHWEFWLVGTSIHKEIEDEVTQKNRAPGHVVEQETYDVRVAVWGDLVDHCLHGLNYIRERLDYDVDQDGALERIRTEYANMLPSFAAAPTTE